MGDDPVVVIKPKKTRWFHNPFWVLVVVISISLLFQSLGTILTFGTADDTNTIVSDIEFRNSPENQAQQSKALEEIILRVDCNARKAIEEAANQVAIDNPSLALDIDLTSQSCSDTRSAESERQSTTTTSTP